MENGRARERERSVHIVVQMERHHDSVTHRDGLRRRSRWFVGGLSVWVVLARKQRESIFLSLGGGPGTNVPSGGMLVANICKPTGKFRWVEFGSQEVARGFYRFHNGTGRVFIHPSFFCCSVASVYGNCGACARQIAMH